MLSVICVSVSAAFQQGREGAGWDADPPALTSCTHPSSSAWGGAEGRGRSRAVKGAEQPELECCSCSKTLEDSLKWCSNMCCFEVSEFPWERKWLSGTAGRVGERDTAALGAVEPTLLLGHGVPLLGLSENPFRQHIPPCRSVWVRAGERQGIPLMEVHLECKVFPVSSLITKLDGCQQEHLQLKSEPVHCEVWAMLWLEFLQQSVCSLGAVFEMLPNVPFPPRFHGLSPEGVMFLALPFPNKRKLGG